MEMKGCPRRVESEGSANIEAPHKGAGRKNRGANPTLLSRARLESFGIWLLRLDMILKEPVVLARRPQDITRSDLNGSPESYGRQGP